jgi:glycosyltransferase involved in cell wall biosynthesis
VGRVFADKGLHHAIRTSKLSGIPLKIAVKIEGPESRAFFDAEVKPHLDGRNVEFLVELGDGDKLQLLGGALGTAFPITWPEPFGLVMIESLACGTPVLARPFGAVPEVLRDGVTGFVETDVDLLARRTLDLASLSRAACRQWVAERFSLGRMIQEHIDIYRSIAGKARVVRAPRRRRNFLHPVQRPAV